MEALEIALRQYGGINGVQCNIGGMERKNWLRKKNAEAITQSDKGRDASRKDSLYPDLMQDSMSTRLQQSSKYGMKFTTTLALIRTIFYRSLQRAPGKGLCRKDFIEMFGKSELPNTRSESHHILLDMFESLDKDGKNYISPEDVLRFFYPSNSSAEIERKKKMVEDIDDWNFNGHTDNKFSNPASSSNSKKLHTERVSELIEIFNVYDKDGNGRLSLQDFIRAVEESWEIPPEKSEIERYFCNADRTGKGFISALDWVDWLQQTTFVSLEDLSKGLRDNYQDHSWNDHVRNSFVDHSSCSTPSTKERSHLQPKLTDLTKQRRAASPGLDVQSRQKKMSVAYSAISEEKEKDFPNKSSFLINKVAEIRKPKRTQSAGTRLNQHGLSRSLLSSGGSRCHQHETKEELSVEASARMARPSTSIACKRPSSVAEGGSCAEEGVDRRVYVKKLGQSSAVEKHREFISLGIVRNCVKATALNHGNVIERLLKSEQAWSRLNQ